MGAAQSQPSMRTLFVLAMLFALGAIFVASLTPDKVHHLDDAVQEQSGRRGGSTPTSPTPTSSSGSRAGNDEKLLLKETTEEQSGRRGGSTPTSPTPTSSSGSRAGNDEKLLL